MKKIAALGLSLLMLSTMSLASAAGAGTQDDPFITRSYAQQWAQDIIARGMESVEDTFDALLRTLAPSQNGQVDIPEGYLIAQGYESLRLPEGGTVSLASGSSIIVLEGTIKVSGLEGSLIDISTAQELSQGDVLNRNVRYFCAEDTSATFSASSAAQVAVEGYYLPGQEEPEEDPETPSDSPYRDVDQEDWFYEAVMYAYEHDIMSGMGDGLFSPKVKLSRAMIAQVLYNMEGAPSASGGETFQDVGQGDWFYDAVAWASANGIMGGYGDGTFGPEADLKREEMAITLYRYAQFKGRDTSAVGDLSLFPDGDSVSSWAREGMSWITGAGLLLGDENNRLQPAGTATRAEAAQLLMRFCEQ